ncbi:hypothetical protein HZA38_04080 [Candidatus Peregrinibacteria bacterium]|nr:hypothetical protein [Candidatus Peregrinibacteria bacterium]
MTEAYFGGPQGEGERIQPPPVQEGAPAQLGNSIKLEDQNVKAFSKILPLAAKNGGLDGVLPEASAPDVDKSQAHREETRALLKGKVICDKEEPALEEGEIELLVSAIVDYFEKWTDGSTGGNRLTWADFSSSDRGITMGRHGGIVTVEYRNQQGHPYSTRFEVVNRYRSKGEAFKLERTII